MEPTPVTYPTDSPSGTDLAHGLTAVVLHGKLPYRVARWRDRACRAVGWNHRAVRADGMTFLVRRGTWADESIINHVVRDREYHPPGYEIAPTDVVIDVGGNIGAFTVSAARAAADGRVYTFEPEPTNFDLLTRNVERNGCGNVTVVNAAVSDRAGTMALSVNPENSGSHSLVREHAGPSVTVRTVTLRSIFDEYRIERCDFLKMDCEGAEYEILYGLPREYFPRVRRVVLEYHAEPDEKRTRADELVRFLKEVGFRVDIYTDIVGARGGLIYATRER